MRCVHEAQLHPASSFITLTYSDEFLPPGGSLVRRAVPDFVKRLRKRVCVYYPDCDGSVVPRISVLYCGEYGELLARPHYHALIFGFDFPDKVPLPRSQFKDPLYRSPLLESLWPFGQSSIGALTFETAQYVARYSMKKVTGDLARDHYRRVDLVTGELVDLVPEFIGMSNRPAIGLRWFEKFGKEVFPDDFVISGGRKVTVPRYYEKLLKRGAASGVSVDFDSVRERRRDRFVAEVVEGEKSPRRLAVKCEVKLAEINVYKRELDK